MGGFHTPSLPKHFYKPDYSAIKETHQLLTANVASIECNLGGGQKGYLGLILLPDQYACVYSTASFLPTNPGIMAQIPAWTPPME